MVTAANLIAGCPELESLDRKKIAALDGVAPHEPGQGPQVKETPDTQRPRLLANALYMAALSASRFNPSIRIFYVRLIASGKVKKLAITACMRKLLTMLNAMMRDNKRRSQATSSSRSS
jgi:transposase